MVVDVPGLSVRLTGGRSTVDDGSIPTFGMQTQVTIPPPDWSGHWQNLTLDQRVLRRIHPFKLAEMLADTSPELSKALWDALRLLNPGWECKVFEPGTKTVSVEGTRVKDEFLVQLKHLHGSVDVPINRLFLAAYMRGAFFEETVLDLEDGRALDIATPDPASARFKRVKDPKLGHINKLGQLQGGRFIDLSDVATVRYTPIDPFPATPYGRPVVAPAIFHSLFLLGLLHDIRRVIRQQGYPRLDLSMSLDALRQNMPENVKGDDKKFNEWVNAVLDQLQNTFDNLPPDASFSHTDAITLNRPIGTLDTSSLGSLGELIKALERFLARALKMVPLILGLAEGTSEANANRQWEIQAAGAKSLQHPLEAILEISIGWALRVAGVQGDVLWKFAEIRAAERMRDAQARQLEIQNEAALYFLGMQSQEQAAEHLMKAEPDQEEPRLIPAGWSAAGGGEPPDNSSAEDPNVDPGANRWIDWHRWGRARRGGRTVEKFKPEGANDDLPPLPLGVNYDQEARRRLLQLWDDAMDDWQDMLDAKVITDESQRSRRNGHTELVPT